MNVIRRVVEHHRRTLAALAALEVAAASLARIEQMFLTDPLRRF